MVKIKFDFYNVFNSYYKNLNKSVVLYFNFNLFYTTYFYTNIKPKYIHNKLKFYKNYRTFYFSKHIINCYIFKN